MKKDLWIFGAGAIGRGYLPWVFNEELYRFCFVDTSISLIERMRQQKSYTTYQAHDGRLDERRVNCESAYTLSEFHEITDLTNTAAVFVSVGPRNCLGLADALARFSVPVILCENDPKTVDWLKAKTGLANFHFGIPDVITSNTAPTSILRIDSLSVVTESGTLFLDEAVRGLKGEYTLADRAELAKQWTAKLYLHNTPHCIAAYLGALGGFRYVHEALAYAPFEKIVRGAMDEMLVALKRRWELPHEFLDWYAAKELARFADPLLHDPIARVAREPLRKLDLDGRLIGAAQICLGLGVTPMNIVKGISAALLYEDQFDNDRHIQMMRRAIPKAVLFSTVLGLRSGEALENVLLEQFDPIATELLKMKTVSRAS